MDVFTLDTGRLPQETHDLIARARSDYRRPIRILFPDAAEVEAFVAAHGSNAFYDSIELRKRCCEIRKLVPAAACPAGQAAVDHRPAARAVGHARRRCRAGARCRQRPDEAQSAGRLVRAGGLGVRAGASTCRPTRCTRAAIRASAAHRARARSSPARTRAPAAGGGSSRPRANAGCTSIRKAVWCAAPLVAHERRRRSRRRSTAHDHAHRNRTRRAAHAHRARAGAISMRSRPSRSSSCARWRRSAATWRCCSPAARTRRPCCGWPSALSSRSACPSRCCTSTPSTTSPR